MTDTPSPTEVVERLRFRSDPDSLNAAKLIESLAGERDAARQFVVELALVLFEHYPQIECDEKQKRDVAQCGYGDWRSEPKKSVGGALQDWWKHVATLADPTFDPFAHIHSIIGATPEPTTPEEEARE